MPEFCSQSIGAKEKGRLAQCEACDLSYKEAARFFTDATPNNFQSHFNSFVLAYPKAAKAMSDQRPTGLGPGETVAWFLYNNVTLGGKNDSCDVYVDGNPFAELKAGAYVKKTNSLYDFKLHRDQDPSVKFIVSAMEREKFAYRVDYNGIAWTYDGVKLGLYNSEQVSRFITPDGKNPVDRDSVVNIWKDLIFDEYVSGKTMGLLQAKTLRMRYLGHLTKDMVGFYRIHRNQPWARVYLPKAEDN